MLNEFATAKLRKINDICKHMPFFCHFFTICVNFSTSNYKVFHIKCLKICLYQKKVVSLQSFLNRWQIYQT